MKKTGLTDEQQLAMLTAEINSPHYAFMMFVVCPIAYIVLLSFCYWCTGGFNPAMGLIGAMAGMHAICAVGLAGYYAVRWLMRRMGVTP